jgi:N-acetylmuramoyl-L-alanine amidase
MKKILLLFIVSFLLIGCGSEKINNPYYETLLKTEKESFIDIIEYTRYGKHLNIKFETSLESPKLVLKNSEHEYLFPLYKDGNYYVTNEYINSGINLDTIPVGKYVLLLKVTTKNEKGEDVNKYYHFKNKTSFSNIEYYTLTRKDDKGNNYNNKVDFVFDTFNDYNFLKIDVTRSELPEDVYDIILDPGHGGNDPGAVNGKYHEADFNLKYALLLKEELENMGLKVKLTRESDISPKTYGYNSRIGIPYEAKAKLMLSLHQNSGDRYANGVEIYMAYGDNPYMAKALADNIATRTSCGYSANTINRVSNGTYLRVFTQSDINASAKKAKSKGWEYYNQQPNTTYYYFIRETGGFITKAFVDGRNPEYEANPYYKENYGTEAYLVEMGFISNKKNLEALTSEQDKYLEALVESVKYYVNSDY